MKIGRRTIGPGHPVFIVAELSANHQGSLDRALTLVEEAHSAGADAIKLQTYTADTLTLKSDKEHFRVSEGTLWEGKTLFELYEEASMPWGWQPELKSRANELGMELFSTPFDDTAVDFLETMNVPAYKVASFEIVDIPLIEKIASTLKPMIISTGMATLEEIHEAVDAARSVDNVEIALLKCTSAYPAPPEEMNLRTIPDMIGRFNVSIGLSDHTLGTDVPVAAVALGACIVEKHFCMSRAEPGPDSAFSLEPHEFKEMVAAIRTAEASPPSGADLDPRILGTVHYGPSKQESKSTQFRRSLFAVKDIKAGEELTRGNVRSIRPAHGLPPKELERVLGHKAKKEIERGTPLQWEMIDK